MIRNSPVRSRKKRPNDALAQPVVALILDLVLQQLWVSIWLDGDWWHRQKEMNAVVEGSSGWHTHGISEDVCELNEKMQEVVGGESKCLQPGGAQPCPLDPMVKSSEHHRKAREVPNNGPHSQLHPSTTS
jgi:hypothetical protein